MTIGSNLMEELSVAENHSIAYASLEGVVDPDAFCLISQNKDSMGVVQQVSVVELKSKWENGKW